MKVSLGDFLSALIQDSEYCTLDQFAADIDKPVDFVYNLLQNKIKMTRELAELLASKIGPIAYDPEFWMNYDDNR